ncbi:MAG TPA: O-antigen ligase family protein [Cytophagaceae bacterium]|nr:O-antigen ligase family protein [Cytophagaceae bacterium]
MAFISTFNNPLFRFRLALISLLTIVLGMFFSRAMMSIGMILIGLQFFMKPSMASTFHSFLNDKRLLYLSFIFFIYLLSGFYSSDAGYFGERLTMKLPLLFMPLGFAALREIPIKYLLHSLALFVLLTFLFAVGSFIIYITHYEEITEGYKNAKVIPVLFKMNHIRFSLILAFGIIAAFYLFVKQYFLLHFKIERMLYLFIGIFLFVFIHILSVRSGLLAFYAALFICIVAYILQRKKYLNGLFLLVLLIITPLMMYATMPTIQNKVNYMIRDISMFMKGEGANDFSDANRLLSIKLGIELGNEHPWFGVGVGDVRNEVFNAYEKKYPSITAERRLIPHNQFVYIYAACGIIGLILFLWFSFYPFFIKKSYSGYLFLSLNAVILSSYLSESTLETQLGVCIYITFYLISCFIEDKNSTAPVVQV